MATTTEQPPAGPATSPTRAQDALDVIGVQTAILVRNFELLRRRSGGDVSLGKAGYLLLRALETLGPSDIGTLAAALGLDPSTVGRQVAMMEQDSLVTRAPASDDRRRSVVTATDEGRHRMSDLSAQRKQSTGELLADWTEHDLQNLAATFARYNEAVARHYLTGIDRLGNTTLEENKQ